MDGATGEDEGGASGGASGGADCGDGEKGGDGRFSPFNTGKCFIYL